MDNHRATPLMRNHSHHSFTYYNYKCDRFEGVAYMGEAVLKRENILNEVFLTTNTLFIFDKLFPISIHVCQWFYKIYSQ